MGRDTLQQIATLLPGVLPEGLSSAQGLALASLLAGKTVTDAARAAGVDRSTVHRWLSGDPEFMGFYGQARREMADAVEQNLRLLAGSAVRNLRVLLNRRRVPDAIKLRAAVAVLQLVSGPVEGPVDPDEARVAIGLRSQRRKLDAMRARLKTNDR